MYKILIQTTLSGLEFLQGALTLAFIVISLMIGLIIISKYFKYKHRQLLLVGLTWTFLVSVYWPDAINFIIIITTGNEINDAIYFFVANAFVAPLHVTWGLVVSELLFKRKKKIIVGILAIEAAIFEIAFIVIFIIDYHLIGTKIGPFIVDWAAFILFYFLVSTLLFLGLGILFCRESLKSKDKEITLKGKFLLGAFISFAIGTIIEIAFIDAQSEFTTVLARIFVIIAALAFYIGFTLPQFFKNILIKE